MLPGESTGFRAEFDGVLSLQDAQDRADFDPDEFLPPQFSAKPTDGFLDARALVNSQNLYRGVSLHGVKFTREKDQLLLSGLAVNSGVETGSIIRITVLLFGPGGRPLWVDAGFVESSVYPGQSADFSLVLPKADQIEVISEIPTSRIQTNGATQQSDLGLPDVGHGTIRLSEELGFIAARLHVTAMTHSPLF